jgi:hypothetical protein
MAAGLGFKTFTTGEVLSASDVNGYLMQGINVFANTTARDAAITSPQEGQFAYTKDTNSLWYYTGSAWAASGAAGDIEGVSVTSPITGGGTSGTVTIGIDSTAIVPSQTGNSGKYLTTNGTTASWGTVSGGGMTLLATTNCSGSSTITFSSISQSYKHLLVTWDYIYNTSASSNMYFQFNSGVSLSWSSVDLNGTSLNGASGGGYSATQSLATPNNSTPGNTGAMWVYDYANTSRYKSFALQSHGYSTASSSLRGYHNYGLIENPSSGITSINLTNGATMGGGQVRLWGVA